MLPLNFLLSIVLTLFCSSIASEMPLGEILTLEYGKTLKVSEDGFRNLPRMRNSHFKFLMAVGTNSLAAKNSDLIWVLNRRTKARKRRSLRVIYLEDWQKLIFRNSHIKFCKVDTPC